MSIHTIMIIKRVCIDYRSQMELTDQINLLHGIFNRLLDFSRPGRVHAGAETDRGGNSSFARGASEKTGLGHCAHFASISLY